MKSFHTTYHLMFKWNYLSIKPKCSIWAGWDGVELVIRSGGLISHIVSIETTAAIGIPIFEGVIVI